MEDNEYNPVEYTPTQPITSEEIRAIAAEQEDAKEATRYSGDDLADLFRGPQPDDPDMDVSDVVNVDIEEDVMDGDLSDVVDVTEEDVMGEDIFGQEDDDLSDLLEVTPGKPASMPDEGEEELPPRRYKLSPRGRRVARALPPTSMGSMELEGD